MLGARTALQFGAQELPSGVDMDSDQDMSGNDTENLQGEVLESLGEPAEGVEEIAESQAPQGEGNRGDALYVQKRLKQQKRQHEREIRELHARIAEMQSQPNQFNNSQQMSPDNAMGNQGGVDDAIHKAVSYALQHKEMEERKAKDMQSQQHIAKQYQELNKHLDNVSDKYDDFDDVVRGDAPFTAHMRDAALMLPKKGPGSAGEVLYKLGKDPEALSRIANLHPVDQAAELVALSHALISGGENKSQANRPLGQIKSNPVVNSAGVNEKTPVSDIRARMKQGTFK
jgi:hypothetical protein